MAPSGPGGDGEAGTRGAGLLHRLLPSGSGDSHRPLCVSCKTEGRKNQPLPTSLSPLGIRVPHAMGPVRAQRGGETEGVARGLGVRDGRSEQLAGLQAQRSWAGRSQGLGTGVALGPMAWRGRVSSSLSCPGWWGCGSESCSIPALETENQPGSLPTAQVSGNPGPTRVSAESLGLLSSPALLQRAAACPLPMAGSSQLLCQLPGRHASLHPLQIHARGHACVSACVHVCLRMCMCIRVCTHPHLHARPCVHVCARVSAYVHVRPCARTPTFTYMPVCACALVCTCICMCASVCAYEPMFTHMSTCAYMLVRVHVCVRVCVCQHVCTCLWACMLVHVLHLPRGSVGGSSAEGPHFHLLLCNTTRNERLKEVRELRRAFLGIPEVGGWPGCVKGLREQRGSWLAA